MKRMRGKHSFLTRLRHDTAGNTIALVAAAIIPLAGMIGGAVDMSRLYLVKTRMQQACDAGALAGRKVMGGASWTTGSDSSDAKAKEMFNANFMAGAYGTSAGGLITNFTEQDGTVTGTASVAVPMTLMRIFNMTERNISVSCTAKMEIPNTDVMFVLDVTYSMQTNNKIGGLKSAVKCFYEALERVNTNEICDGKSGDNDPKATSYTGSAQIRLGFVPYGVNVNVGKLLPQEYMADSWTYQSRVYGEQSIPVTTEGSWTFTSGTKSGPTNVTGSSNCSGSTTTQLSTPTTSAPDANGVTKTTTTRTTNGTEISGKSGSGSNTKCKKTTYNNYIETKVDTTTPTKAYTYKPVELNINGLKKADGTWNTSVSLPVGSKGANTNVTWDGCVEERHTFQNSDGDPTDDWTIIPPEALDMDINLVPSNSSTYNSFWGPMLNNAVWARYSTYTCSKATCATWEDQIVTTDDRSRSTAYYCPTEARKLREYKTSADVTNFQNYVGSLSATAMGTYHDIGMIWGARLLSPVGLFASENAATPAGRPIKRHLIFMTDGNAQTVYNNYMAYGITCQDKRQLSTCPDKTADVETRNDQLVNARMVALCTAVKNMGITLWVVSYGDGVDTENGQRLSQCASNKRYYEAKNAVDLRKNFQQIAAEISELRLIN